MKSSALVAGLALLALALPGAAQEFAPPMPPPAPNAVPPNKKQPADINYDQVPQCPPCPPAMVLEDTLVGIPVTPPQYPRVWADFDALLWWLKPNYISAPLITTTRVPEDLASSITAGGLSDPNAAVLFGQQTFRTNPQPGGRLRVGVALDTEGTQAVEVSGFWLPWQVERFNAVSNDANGNPSLALPFHEVFPTSVETANIVAGTFDGSVLHGSVLINNGTQMWGGEANFVKMLASTCAGEFDLIVGFRYLYLEDYLTIDASTSPADGGSTHDRFDTKNAFYGGQVGVRHVIDCDSWRVETNVKFALGDTNETLNISGASNLPVFAAGSTLPGGFYTASSNIGNTSTNRFGFVTEVGFNVAYKLTDNVQLTAGYTYLYWDHLERSGNQIDHNLNPSLNPALSVISPAGGPAAPQRLNTESSFWAQGINVGVRFSY